jgi:hypothetical protein
MSAKQLIKEWTGSHNEAVEIIVSVLNNGTDADDIKESLENHFIDNGLMTEKEFIKAVNQHKGGNND